MPRSISEYLDDLELRHDEPLPTKFRCRLRLGRGGRLVVDRVPVYVSRGSAPLSAAALASSGAGVRNAGAGVAGATPILEGDENDEPVDLQSAQPLLSPGEQHFSGTYVYPTVFNSRLLKGASGNMAAAAAVASSASTSVGGGGVGLGDSAVPGLGAGPGAAMNGAGAPGAIRPQAVGETVKAAPHRQLFALPPTMPPERACVAASLVHRQKDIYNYSDSEDEWVELEAAPCIARPRTRPYASMRF